MIFKGLAPGAVKMDHAKVAMTTLARFDAVLILEQLDDSFAQSVDPNEWRQRRLYARLRWCTPAAADRSRSFGKRDRLLSRHCR